MLKLISSLAFFLLPFSVFADYPVYPSSHKTPQEKCLQVAQSYPEAFDVLTQDLAILKNGRVLYCENPNFYNLKSKEDFLLQLGDVSLADILDQEYFYQYSAPVYEYNLSPGRIRNNQVFINAYIDISSLSTELMELSQKDKFTAAELKKLNRALSKEIQAVPFLSFKIQMNKRNGAAEALERVGQRLSQEAPQAAKWLQQTRNMSGGFNLRYISGTQRLSSHSWGIAVDFTLKKASSNVNFNDSYWKWVSTCAPHLNCPPPRSKGSVSIRNKAQEKDLEVFIDPEHFDHFEEDVVRIFAEEGFIWGGHWHHFDTMHFEYRPEFFIGPLSN